jgi:hypothetical protein
MASQNSIYAPPPFALNKGGTANTTTLANGQTWIGNGTATPAVANLTGANGIAITNGSGTIQVGQATTLTNGQLWVGNTGNVPTAATITGGTNIGVTNAAGSITVAATGAASWTIVVNNSSAVNMSPFITYINNFPFPGAPTLFQLPTPGTLGNMFEIISNFQNSFTIIVNGGPISNSMLYNNNSGGRLTTTSFTAGITLICVGGGSSPRYSVKSTNGELFTLTP